MIYLQMSAAFPLKNKDGPAFVSDNENVNNPHVLMIVQLLFSSEAQTYQ